MPVSPAKAQSDARYFKKAYDALRLVVRKDAELTADNIKEHVSRYDKSINQFILRAVKETIARDRQHEEVRGHG